METITKRNKELISSLNIGTGALLGIEEIDHSNYKVYNTDGSIYNVTIDGNKVTIN